MSERFFCERCAQDFESVEARCPKCLRKSSVQAKGARTSTSEAARLAAGDHTLTSSGRRAAALVTAIALSAALGAMVLLVWSPLTRSGTAVPAIVAALVASGLWIRAALLDLETDARPWVAFAKRCATGAGLGVWAFVCGILALLAGSDLSVPFAVAIGVLLFFGGVVPV
jgi:hypothetical protein